LGISWNLHGITDGRGGDPDVGHSYRPALFYRSPEQLTTIERVQAKLQKDLNTSIAAEVLPFSKFWTVEGYHQDFTKRHPTPPYVMRVSLPSAREMLGQ
jgi:peptide-methionine (S)-S-oxide reductase